MSLQEKATLIKGKKDGLLGEWLGNYFEHPNRLAEISISGSVSFVYDGREANDNPQQWDTARYEEVQASVGGLVIERVAPTRLPMWEAPETPGEGEIYLTHVPRRLWEFVPASGKSAEEVVGTHTITFYLYESGSWVEQSTATVDATGALTAAIFWGGFAASGGNDGATLATVQGSILIDSELIVTSDANTPLAEEERAPWEDVWESLEIRTDYSDLGDGYSGTAELFVRLRRGEWNNNLDFSKQENSGKVAVI